MKRNTIVIGFAEAEAAPEVTWSLIDAGFRVVAFARQGRRSALRHSRHVVCYDVCPPESDMQRSVADLRHLLRIEDKADKGGPKLLLPLDDTALKVGDELQLPADWVRVGPDHCAAQIALNKYLQTELARQAGFNVPRTMFVASKADLFASCLDADFPIILKPVDCVPVRGGRRIVCRKWICANTRELEIAAEEWEERVPLLLQRYISGVGEGVFGLATDDGIRAWSGHRRLRMMNPEGSGSSACASQDVPLDLRTKAEELIRAADWRGLFMIELLRDRDDKHWFVELNGRPWGSIALARRQGLEYAAWSAQLALNQTLSPGTEKAVSPGVVCRNLGREFMHLLFVLRGPKSKAVSDWPPLWKSLGAVLRVQPGDQYYNWRRDDVNVFLADCCYTIRNNLFKQRG